MLREQLQRLFASTFQCIFKRTQAGAAHCAFSPEFFERIVADSLKRPARLCPVLIDRLNRMMLRDWRNHCTDGAVTGERDALFSQAEQDRLVAVIPHA